MRFDGVHHIALIASDFARSKHFYTQILGFEVIAENFRAHRGSYKLDLQVPGGTRIELFSFPAPPPRPSNPEACGLRHLAFAVANLDAAILHLRNCAVEVQEPRVDEYTGNRFSFFTDPDGLPLELYEIVTAL